MQNLTRFFAIVHKQSQLFITNELKSLHISRGQYMYIMCICENAGVSQEQIAALVNVDKSAVTKAIQNLLEAGFITREADGTDKRVNSIYPTPKAEAAYIDIMAAGEKWHAEIMQDMSDVEKDIFKRILDKVHLEPYPKDLE